MHIDLPIALGVVGAYLGSLYGWAVGEERFMYFDFLTVFIFLMLVGRWAQVVAVEHNQRRLLRRQPKAPRVRALAASGAPADVVPEALEVGQVFFLASGQTAPVEARLESAAAAFSLASVNGEAAPRVFQPGQRVPAGAVNISRKELRLVARQRWAESLLAQLLQPGERVGERHRLLERVVRGYLIGIIAVALAGGAGWWWATHDGLRAGAVVVAVLVVSCPCAIGLAFPLADELATAALRRRGVFVRESDLWSRLGRVRQLVFDKTGTLTLEAPVLQNPEALRALDAAGRAALHALVRDNAHPVSQSLLEQLLADGAPEPLPGPVEETVGVGVELVSVDQRWRLGRPAWALGGNASEGLRGAGDAGALSAEQEVALACDGRLAATFRFADVARSDARAELAVLAARGFDAFILSGDSPGKVAKLTRELGLPEDRGLGRLAPQQKADWLARHDHRDTLMLGDGANDSLAFDRAFCRGTPVIHRGLLERKADFYYLGRGIGGIRALLEVNAVRRRTQIAILAFSIAYNLLAVGLAVAGRMNPLVAAILMPINSLLTLAITTGGMRRALVA